MRLVAPREGSFLRIRFAGKQFAKAGWQPRAWRLTGAATPREHYIYRKIRPKVNARGRWGGNTWKLLRL